MMTVTSNGAITTRTKTMQIVTSKRSPRSIQSPTAENYILGAKKIQNSYNYVAISFVEKTRTEVISAMHAGDESIFDYWWGLQKAKTAVKWLLN